MPSYKVTYDFATARYNAVFHNRLRFMLNVCLTIIIFLKWDVLSQDAPHVLTCQFVVDNETGEDILSTVHLPLELICSPLLLAYLLTGGFLLKHRFYQFLVLYLDQRYCPRAK